MERTGIEPVTFGLQSRRPFADESGTSLVSYGALFECLQVDLDGLRRTEPSLGLAL